MEMHTFRFGLPADNVSSITVAATMAGIRAVALSGLTLVALWGFVDRADAATAVKATIKRGVLTVDGTAGADAITLRLRGGDPNTLEVDVGADGTADFQFDRQRFTAIAVNGGAGDDIIIADLSNGSFTDTELTTLDGSDGKDTLVGANGDERLTGGPGDDFVDGNQGTDTVALGDGADTFQWDPGDGNDTILGGSGADKLVFNGSGANEVYDVSAVADHVRLFRNVGSVVMNLDDIETIDLRPLGGTDTVAVNNLSGTDLTEIHTDLAAFGGGDDAQIDAVVVPPGLVISQEGPAAIVEGLGAQVRVLNGSVSDRIHITGSSASDVVSVAGTANADTVAAVADGTDVVVQGATPGVHVRLTGVERLNIDLAAGDDHFSAVGNLAALVALDIDGGDDKDAILGGNGADVLTGGPGDDFVDGNQGTDTVALGDGADAFQWDPGDGNDTILGGSGADKLVFNGSSANEVYDVSAVADHVRLFRNVGSVVMDLDEIEAIDLRPLGGTDTVAVNNLSGTDLTEIHTDLAAFGGTAADGVIDEVIVNGTESDDAIAVVDDSSVVVVQGLVATVRIAHADPILDRLTVNGLEGNDAITATPGASALILLNLQP
jgi:Ca2+-binding RTX toxin-like protein